MSHRGWECPGVAPGPLWHLAQGRAQFQPRFSLAGWDTGCQDLSPSAHLLPQSDSKGVTHL